jgi:hypothetical protein
MRKLILAVMLAAVVGVAWRTVTRDADEPKLLFDRVWVDHQPRDPAERFQALWVNGERPFGHFASRTMWLGQWEFFHYHVIPREDGVMDFLFGATREQQRVRYTVRSCNDNGFDLCLDITGSSRGARHYYSKKEWRLGAGELDRVGELVQSASGAR